MTDLSKEEDVLKIIVEKMDCLSLSNDLEGITLDTKLKDVLDSLDVAELAMELEKDLPKAITEQSIRSWETFEDIVKTYLIASDNV